MSDTSIPPMRRCTKCGEEYPATLENFYKIKTGKYGLAAICKSCSAIRGRRFREDHRDRIQESRKRRHLANPEKTKESHRRWRQANIEKKRELDKRYRLENLEKKREYNRHYRLKHQSALREYSSQWRKANPERAREGTRHWVSVNPDKNRAYRCNRRARKLSLPDTLTGEQWMHCVEYFNGCCVACGRQCNDLFKTYTLSMDHWIPLSSPDCPGTVATNIVPLCNGVGGCNNSKKNKPPEVWVIRKFGKRKAEQILARVSDYFDSIKGNQK